MVLRVQSFVQSHRLQRYMQIGVYHLNRLDEIPRVSRAHLFPFVRLECSHLQANSLHLRFTPISLTSTLLTTLQTFVSSTRDFRAFQACFFAASSRSLAITLLYI